MGCNEVLTVSAIRKVTIAMANPITTERILRIIFDEFCELQILLLETLEDCKNVTTTQKV